MKSAHLWYYKLSIRHSAWMLQRSPSTISRVIARNKKARSYDAEYAQRKHEQRKRAAHTKTPLKCLEIQAYMESHLIQGWSPEQIVSVLSLEYPHYSPNYESIYRISIRIVPTSSLYCEEDPVNVNDKRKKRGLKKEPCVRIVRRIPIAERGNIAHEYGHYEVDLVVSSSKAPVVALLKQKSSMYSSTRLYPWKRGK